jgi:hypothetical protein
MCIGCACRASACLTGCDFASLTRPNCSHCSGGLPLGAAVCKSSARRAGVGRGRGHPAQRPVAHLDVPVQHRALAAGGDGQGRRRRRRRPRRAGRLRLRAAHLAPVRALLWRRPAGAPPLRAQGRRKAVLCALFLLWSHVLSSHKRAGRQRSRMLEVEVSRPGRARADPVHGRLRHGRVPALESPGQRAGAAALVGPGLAGHAAPRAAQRTALPASVGVAAAPARTGLGRAPGRWLQLGSPQAEQQQALVEQRCGRGCVGVLASAGLWARCSTECPGATALGWEWHFLTCICTALAGLHGKDLAATVRVGASAWSCLPAAGVVFRPLCLGRLCLGVRTAYGAVERVACTKPVVAAGAPIHFDF